MNRTVRRRLVAVPWSLFPREPSVGQVLSLSLLWRGHDCRTWAVTFASSPQGQRADSLHLRCTPFNHHCLTCHIASSWSWILEYFMSQNLKMMTSNLAKFPTNLMLIPNILVKFSFQLNALEDALLKLSDPEPLEIAHILDRFQLEVSKLSWYNLATKSLPHSQVR